MCGGGAVHYKNPVRALFFGTPAIAVPALDALHGIAEVAAVVCQPDRPSGRGLELRPPPVKVRAAELGLPVVQPAKVRTPEFAAWARDLGADVALVIAYGRILPPAVLDAPRRGCLNLHASILPFYRGAAPITWAVVRGETETGVSLMQMDEGMDTGPVFTVHRVPIGPETTADELGVTLGALAAEVVRRDVARAVAGEIAAAPQDHAAATMAPILEKEDGRIAWHRPARAVHDHVRGMTSWPGAFTAAHGKTLKVLESRVGAEGGEAAPPGTVVAATRAGVVVACGAGTLQILRAQLEGRKALGAVDLVSGRTLVAGMLLG
jgi:methionyl-tRNA formyltransferase